MNSQLTLFIVFVACAILFAYVFLRTGTENVDTLYVHGRVYTMDSQMSVVEAFAVRGDRVVMTGSERALRRRVNAKAIVDLRGKTVFPGFIDAHGHMLSLGLAKMTVDLDGVASDMLSAALVGERVSKVEPGQWVRGRGWDQNLWPSKQFPTHAVLDRVAPNNPVYLVRTDGHATWVNKKALEIAGISKGTPDPEGGKIVRDAAGNPTGVFVDNAMELVSRFLPPPTERESDEAITLAFKECLKHGITCAHDMGVDQNGIDTYKRLIDKQEFPFRVYAAIDGPGETWDQYVGRNGLARKSPFVGYGGNKLWVRALKLYVDGALGSRGAALMEPYSDDPTNRGLTVTDEASLRHSVKEAVENGFQVCTHAIGDRANNIILNVYEQILKSHAADDYRLRVEHAQVLSLNDIPRFKSLGIIPSMQPTHCTSDMMWAEARLGAARVLGAYAWRSLLSTGVMIPGGSDFPVESPDPLLGIYAAVTRQNVQGLPRNAADVLLHFQLSSAGIHDTAAFDGGWYASQKMTRVEATRAFTTWAAYAGFQENQLGSLEKNKLADFVVLSEDIMNIQASQIPATRVEKTFVGGKQVYGDGDDQEMKR